MRCVSSAKHLAPMRSYCRIARWTTAASKSSRSPTATSPQSRPRRVRVYWPGCPARVRHRRAPCAACPRRRRIRTRAGCRTCFRRYSARVRKRVPTRCRRTPLPISWRARRSRPRSIRRSSRPSVSRSMRPRTKRRWAPHMRPYQGRTPARMPPLTPRRMPRPARQQHRPPRCPGTRKSIRRWLRAAPRARPPPAGRRPTRRPRSTRRADPPQSRRLRAPAPGSRLRVCRKTSARIC
jgi:hypothetical protein